MTFFGKISLTNKIKMSSTTAITAINNGDQVLKCIEFTYKSCGYPDFSGFNISTSDEFNIEFIKECLNRMQEKNKEIFYLNYVTMENDGCYIYTQLFICEDSKVFKHLNNLVSILCDELIKKFPSIKSAFKVEIKEYNFEYINTVIINEFLQQYITKLATAINPLHSIVSKKFYFMYDIDNANLDEKYNLFEDKKYINSNSTKKLYNLLTYIANNINNGSLGFKLFSHYLPNKQNKRFELYFDIDDCNKTIDLKDKLERIFTAINEIKTYLNNILKSQYTNEIVKFTPIVYTTENVYKNSWTVVKSKCAILVEVKNQFKPEFKLTSLKNISKNIITLIKNNNNTTENKLAKEIISFIEDENCNFNLLSANQYYLYSFIQQIVTLTINHVNPNDKSDNKAFILLYTLDNNNTTANVNKINDMTMYLGELNVINKFVNPNLGIFVNIHNAIISKMCSIMNNNDYNWNSTNNAPKSVTTGLYSKSVLDKVNGYSLLVAEFEFSAGYKNIGDKNSIIKEYFDKNLYKLTAFQYDCLEVTEANTLKLILIVMINEKFIDKIRTQLIDIINKQCLNKCKMQVSFLANTSSDKIAKKTEINDVKVYLNNMYLYFGDNDKVKYSIYNNKQFIDNVYPPRSIVNKISLLDLMCKVHFGKSVLNNALRPTNCINTISKLNEINCSKDFNFTINDDAISIFSIRLPVNSQQKIGLPYVEQIWKPAILYLSTSENHRFFWATFLNRIKQNTNIFLKKILLNDEEMLLHSCVLSIQFMSYAEKITKNNNVNKSILEMVIVIDKSMIELCNKNGFFEYNNYEELLTHIYHKSLYDTIIEITMNTNVNNYNNYDNLLEIIKFNSIYEYLKLSEDIIKYNSNNIASRSYYSNVDFILRVAFLKMINKEIDLKNIHKKINESNYSTLNKNLVKSYLYKTLENNDNKIYSKILEELKKNLLKCK